MLFPQTTVFGKWTVLSDAGRDKKSNKLVLVRCECGKEKTQREYLLKRGESLGCRQCFAKKFRQENDLTGKQFNKWTVLLLSGIKSKNAYYLCRCECGREKEVSGWSLNRGRSGACPNCRIKDHGMSKTSTFRIWSGILRRCTNENFKSYKYYGGRGITVCDRWLLFENFLEDMGIRPEGLQIDRINNDGNYEPGNCRWTTPKENLSNRNTSLKNRRK
jgi:hypothetical protein